jgi:nuclease S1
MRTLLFVPVALLMSASPALGWGCDGHQIVALIAQAHLTPVARAAVEKILAADPISTAHNKFCQDNPLDPMAVAAPWADDVKSSTKTFLWHQIDIPISVDSGDYKKWCDPIGPSVNGKDRPGCIINAVQYEWGILRDEKASAAARGIALRMIIHLMGDLTEPLHVSDNFDEGGNCTTFTVSFLDKPTNLHAIWDYELISREMQQKKITEMTLAEMLDKEFASRYKEWGERKIYIEGWTWEAHRIGVSQVYGQLKPPLPIQPANAGTVPNRAVCDAGRDKIAAMHIPVEGAYIDNALPVIHEQLAKGGYRLAEVLNDTFDKTWSNKLFQ